MMMWWAFQHMVFYAIVFKWESHTPLQTLSEVLKILWHEFCQNGWDEFSPNGGPSPSLTASILGLLKSSMASFLLRYACQVFMGSKLMDFFFFFSAVLKSVQMHESTSVFNPFTVLGHFPRKGGVQISSKLIGRFSYFFYSSHFTMRHTHRL